MQLSRIGMEKTTDMNRPLLSKYCCLENRAQFRAATSFILSEKYTSSTEKEIEVFLNFVKTPCLFTEQTFHSDMDTSHYTARLAHAQYLPDFLY
jgi:hypothetical protein